MSNNLIKELAIATGLRLKYHTDSEEIADDLKYYGTVHITFLHGPEEPDDCVEFDIETKIGLEDAWEGAFGLFELSLKQTLMNGIKLAKG